MRNTVFIHLYTFWGQSGDFLLKYVLFGKHIFLGVFEFYVGVWGIYFKMIRYHLLFIAM